MRKLVALLILAVLTVSLAACGGSKQAESSNKDPSEVNGPIPYGIYQFLFLSDENGEYLAKANETEGSNGETMQLRQIMYDAGDLWYFHIGEEGEGFMTDTASGVSEKAVSFHEGSFTDADGKEYRYKKDGDRFWYEESPGSWAVMEKASQGVIDLILAGKGGSVPLNEAKVGDLVCLGTYEQIPGNDKTEPIYWKVLDKKDNELFLVSEKLLDAYAFNRDGWNEYAEAGAPVTWSGSSVRNFLNGEFIENCFTDGEAALMVTKRQSNRAANDYLSGYWNFDRDPYSNLKKQNHKDDESTSDKVFLLSVNEIRKYFGKEEGSLPEYTSKEEKQADYPFSELPTHPSRIANVTKAIAGNGTGYFDEKTLRGAWMTRTLCDGYQDNSTGVVYVTGRGQFFEYFTNVPLYIRPAMWVTAISIGD